MSSYRRRSKSHGNATEKTVGVHYLRVSSTKQTHTGSDIDRDGNSIATQHEECDRKAAEMAVTVQHVFVEPGKSAMSIDKRPEFRKLLAYLAEHPEVGYVFVYARSRAFRNVEEAVLTRRHLRGLGIRIISTKEDFGVGLEAEFMEVISDTMNDLQDKRSGEDIKMKMAHSARNGGTIGRAPIGYLNTRKSVEGNLVNTIAVDQERAPLIRMAFELYATGEYSIDALKAVMDDQGLTVRPNNRWPERRPVSPNTLLKVLGDPYYAGYTVYDNELFSGRHEAIVSQQLFDTVQDVLDARSTAGSRMRKHHHPFKGLVRCGRCHTAGRDYRLIYTEVKGRSGKYYGYYLCRGRQEGVCDLPHLAVARVEQAVEGYITSMALPHELAETLGRELDGLLTHEHASAKHLDTNLRKELQSLDTAESRLIDAIEDDVLPRDKIRERLAAIQRKRASITERLQDTTVTLAVGAKALRNAIALCETAHDLYTNAPDQARSLVLQGLFHTLYVDEHADITDAAPNAIITDLINTLSAHRHLPEQKQNPHPKGEGSDRPALSNLLGGISHATGSSKRVLVDVKGLEPLTSRV